MLSYQSAHKHYIIVKNGILKSTLQYFLERGVYFTVHSLASIQTGKGYIWPYIPRLVLVRIQCKMYIAKSIVCLTTHVYAAEHLCRLLPPAHWCSFMDPPPKEIVASPAHRAPSDTTLTVLPCRLHHLSGYISDTTPQ